MLTSDFSAPAATNLSDAEHNTDCDALDGRLFRHTAFNQIFQPGQLTFGFVAPLEAYPDGPSPTLADHAMMVRRADELGFPVIWLRDVPFYDPSFGDVAQVMDPMVYGGWLAAQTSRIAIGTAGIVLPLRDPIAVAKQATSIDNLSGARFLLGLSTGDRPTEYPVFGMSFESRAELYRDALAVIRATTEVSFGTFRSRHYGRSEGAIDLVPKPIGERLPILGIGRAGQELSWLAANTDGWIWHLSDFRRLPGVIAQWREASEPFGFKPYGYGTFFDLDADPDAPLQVAVGHGIRTGRRALVELWKRQRDEGVNHVALNLRPSRRPAADVMAELAEHVLPQFQPLPDNTEPPPDHRDDPDKDIRA